MSYTGAYMVRYDVVTDEYVYSNGARYRASDLQMTHPGLNPYLTYPGLNQYQGLGGLHGGHWNTSQTTYSSTSNGTHQGYAGIQAQAAALHQSQFLAQQAAISSLANAYAQQRAGLTHALTGIPYQEPKIEHAGIKAGEIIAWRCWSIHIGRMQLRSVFVGAVWNPGEPMTGDLRYAGVHAWKDRDVARDYIQYLPPYAIGQVKLWGEVIEHEKGYRAENAKIVSLDEVEVSGWVFRRNRVIRNLRKKYGVN